MLIKTIHNWELPEAAATPEDIFWNRRQVLKTMGLGAAAIGATSLAGLPEAFAAGDPSADLDSNGIADLIDHALGNR